MAGLTNITGGQLIKNRPGAQVFWVGSTASSYVAYKGVTPSDGNDGLTPQRALATIQAGLDKCTAGRGDTVALLPGSWTVTAVLTMTKADVRLCAAMPVAWGAKSSAVIVNATDVSTLTINADNCSIDGIYFDDNVATATASSQAVAIGNTAACTGVCVQNCFIDMEGSDSDRNALVVGDGTLIVTRSVIENNIFHDPDQDGIIVNVACVAITIRENYIYDKVTANAVRHGINMCGSNCFIDGNEIDIAGLTCIRVAGDDNHIMGNKLSNSTANGFCIQHASGVVDTRSWGNYLLATASGNLCDFTTSCAAGNVAANFACTWSSNPAPAAFDTPTVDGS